MIATILTLGIISVLCHGVGVLVGAKLSGKVNLRVLRLLVAALSITAACYMLVQQAALLL